MYRNFVNTYIGCGDANLMENDDHRDVDDDDDDDLRAPEHQRTYLCNVLIELNLNHRRAQILTHSECLPCTYQSLTSPIHCP